jgi:hypothetical protein
MSSRVIDAGIQTSALCSKRIAQYHAARVLPWSITPRNYHPCAPFKVRGDMYGWVAQVLCAVNTPTVDNFRS